MQIIDALVYLEVKRESDGEYMQVFGIKASDAHLLALRAETDCYVLEIGTLRVRIKSIPRTRKSAGDTATDALGNTAKQLINSAGEVPKHTESSIIGR